MLSNRVLSNSSESSQSEYALTGAQDASCQVSRRKVSEELIYASHTLSLSSADRMLCLERGVQAQLPIDE